MKKRLIGIFLFTIICLAFVGCGSTKEDEVKKDDVVKVTEENKKETQKEDNFKVDWEKCIEDTKKELTNKEYFDYVKDVYIKVEDKRITFTAALADATNDKVALDFADTMLRRFNANAQLQDSSIKGGEKNYLGGLYDTYNISIGIAPLSKTNSQKDWYVFDAISKGVQREPKLQK
ncbi:hypothetical protein K144312032_14280 [Clostridium tetani]|uniref:hypothetical protein n=1 Tax=Clostridium tetani TaxID=1513 RepID=UPI00100BD65B|nr:hypothetical protein [Clostridium tetani]RXM68356.1 hypothetical protein DP139_12305 [Clostridium tetani]BDR67200.1 hypothetical protein K144312032_14280 [Clostridium tetani]